MTGKDVAIKKLYQPFRSREIAMRVYRELLILMHFNHPDAQVSRPFNTLTQF